MSARSMTSHMNHPYSNTSELSSFAEVFSEPWPTEAGDPFIFQFATTEDSDLGKAYSHAVLLLVITLILSADVKVHCGRLKGAVSEDGGNAGVPLCRVGGASRESSLTYCQCSIQATKRLSAHSKDVHMQGSIALAMSSAVK